jgi:hypothetical protein
MNSQVCLMYWPDIGGVYIYVKETDQCRQPIYIGIAASFKARITYHEKWFDSQHHGGATHIHTRIEIQVDVRRNLEQLLIAVFKPVLNTHCRCWTLRDLARSGAAPWLLLL